MQSEAPGVAQALVFESHDLVKLIIKELFPRDWARVQCINKLWRDAVEGEQEEYYQKLWPVPAALKSQVHGCYRMRPMQRVDDVTHVAFCMAQLKGANLLTPYGEFGEWNGIKGCCYARHYNRDNNCIYTMSPVTRETLLAFSQEVVLAIFLLTLEDGELQRVDTLADTLGRVRTEVYDKGCGGKVYIKLRAFPKVYAEEYDTVELRLDFAPLKWPPIASRDKCVLTRARLHTNVPASIFGISSAP
eukprot:jgi/Chlat1/3827/Chrsp26S00295